MSGAGTSKKHLADGHLADGDNGNTRYTRLASGDFRKKLPVDATASKAGKAGKAEEVKAGAGDAKQLNATRLQGEMLSLPAAEQISLLEKVLTSLSDKFTLDERQRIFSSLADPRPDSVSDPDSHSVSMVSSGSVQNLGADQGEDLENKSLLARYWEHLKYNLRPGARTKRILEDLSTAILATYAIYGFINTVPDETYSLEQRKDFNEWLRNSFVPQALGSLYIINNMLNRFRNNFRAAFHGLAIDATLVYSILSADKKEYSNSIGVWGPTIAIALGALGFNGAMENLKTFEPKDKNLWKISAGFGYSSATTLLGLFNAAFRLSEDIAQYQGHELVSADTKSMILKVAAGLTAALALICGVLINVNLEAKDDVEERTEFLEKLELGELFGVWGIAHLYLGGSAVAAKGMAKADVLGHSTPSLMTAILFGAVFIYLLTVGVDRMNRPVHHADPVDELLGGATAALPAQSHGSTRRPLTGPESAPGITRFHAQAKGRAPASSAAADDIVVYTKEPRQQSGGQSQSLPPPSSVPGAYGLGS